MKEREIVDEAASELAGTGEISIGDATEVLKTACSGLRIRESAARQRDGAAAPRGVRVFTREEMYAYLLELDVAWSAGIRAVLTKR